MPKRGGADEIPVIAEGAPALRWHERWKATADIVQWVSRGAFPISRSSV